MQVQNTLLLCLLVCLIASGSTTLIYGTYKSHDNHVLKIYHVSKFKVLVVNRRIRVCKVTSNSNSAICHRNDNNGKKVFIQYTFLENPLSIEERIVGNNSTRIIYTLTNRICTSADDMYDGQWFYSSKTYNKSELWNYCPVFRESWGIDLQNGGNRLNYDCDGYRHAEYYGKNNCTVMSIGSSLKIADVLFKNNFLKNHILFVGDSLSFIHQDAAICEFEHYNITSLITKQAWTTYISYQPACCDYCLDPNSKEEHFKQHCSNCYNSSNVKEENVKGLFPWLNEIDNTTGAIIFGSGAWYNTFHGINPTEKVYRALLNFLGPIMGKIAKANHISLFWQDLPPITSIKKKEYGWEYFTLMNELSHATLPKYGFNLLKTEKSYFPRKLNDPKVSADMVHFCGPGPYSMNTQTFRFFMHTWVQSINTESMI